MREQKGVKSQIGLPWCRTFYRDRLLLSMNSHQSSGWYCGTTNLYRSCAISVQYTKSSSEKKREVILMSVAVDGDASTVREEFSFLQSGCQQFGRGGWRSWLRVLAREIRHSVYQDGCPQLWRDLWLWGATIPKLPFCPIQNGKKKLSIFIKLFGWNSDLMLHINLPSTCVPRYENSSKNISVWGQTNNTWI